MSKSDEIIPFERIASGIYLIRKQKVMIDSDLAELYSVPTGRLNEQITRNLDRFPEDFSAYTKGVWKLEVANCDIKFMGRSQKTTAGFYRTWSGHAFKCIKKL